MNYRNAFRMLISVFFVLGAAATVWAHEVKVDYVARLGDGPELQPGTYRLELIKTEEANVAAFYSGSELAARVVVKVQMETEKSRRTEVHYEALESGRVINQVRVRGWKERLIFREKPQTPAMAE